MKSKTWTRIIALVLFAALALPLVSSAQEQKAEHHHYKLIDVGTFGGPDTNFITQGVGAQVLNNRGMVTGSADTSVADTNTPNCLNPDCFISHAFKWQKGSLSDLGALPGVNSSFGSWITANGLVAGQSGNGEIDPLTGGPEARAVFWNDGPIIDLGTFGGNESYANAVNSRGQVVGSAANAISDPFNTPPFLYGWGTQMHGFLWEDGAMHDLGTLGGPDSLAYWVNEKGQVAGFSYINSTPNPLTGVPPGHPFLWENGTMHDLGTIGGTQVFDLDGLNEHGQIIGQMTLADEGKSHPFLWDGKRLIDLGTFGGDHANANWFNEAGEVVGHSQYSTLCPGPGEGPIDHAYLWRNGDMSDLGTVPGINPLQGLSSAWGINSKTQIVGNSATCDFTIFDGFLWENGSMVDLNTLTPPDSVLHVELPVYISDRGEITGLGSLPDGDVHSFLLIPCDENHPNVEGCDYSMVDTPVGEVRDNLTQREGTSSANSKLESGPALMLRSPSSDESNSLNRLRHRLAFGPSPKNQQSPSNTKSVGLTITSGTPPNGESGVSYGPSTTEYLKCYASPVLGWHQVCTPCSSFSSGCVSLPPCRGLFPSPCVKTEVVYLGVVLTATGGIAPYEWSASGLPPGLTLNSQKGLISGIPITAGSYNLTVNVHDSAVPPKLASAHYNILISP